MQDLPTQFYGRSALAFLLDPLLLIPCFEWTCHATVRLVARWLPIFGGPTVTRSHCFRPNGQRKTPLFLRVDPVFLSPFAAGHRLPARENRPRAHSCNFIAWTHFCSFRLIDDGVRAVPQSTRKGWLQDRPRKEVAELGYHCKGADWPFDPFGQHRDPVGAQISEEPSPF